MTDTSLNGSRIRTSRRPGRVLEAKAQPMQDTVDLEARRPSIMILLFTLSLIIPNIFFLGPLRLSVYKTILLVMFIPVVFMWLSGRAGRIRKADYLIVFSGIWMVIALVAVHGFSRLEIAGMFMMETIGAYLMARVFIRTPADFAFFIKCLCWTVLLLLPLIIVEAMTSRLLLSEVMSKLSAVYPDLQDEMRFGMHRAQGPFEHPILFGVYAATMFAPALLVWGYGRNGFSRTLKGSVVGLGTFLSLSMGAYISVFIQVAFLVWNRVFRNVQARWVILSSIFAAFYVLIDVLSNRNPIQVFVSTITFRSGASYNRILIWNYGTDEVWRHPLFGIGFNDWVRPPWMVASVDNFWLLTAMKFGLPAITTMLAAFIITIYKTAYHDVSGSQKVTTYRYAFIFGLIGIMLSLCTVTVWNATYVFLLFFLGSGMWIRDYVAPKVADAEGDAPIDEDEDDRPKYQSARTRLPRTPRPSQREIKRHTRAPRKTRT